MLFLSCKGFLGRGGGVGVFGLRDFFGGFVFGFFEVANSSRASVIGIVIGVHWGQVFLTR